MNSIKIPIILAIAVALGRFALDTYLPAFPIMAAAMQTTDEHMGLTLSVYIFGLALSQLIGGPLSDYLGRAKVIFSGLLIFAFASLMLAFSHTFTELLLWRVIQALGGGWSVVSIPAIIRDRTIGKETVKLISMVALISTIAPALAPSIGSLIISRTGWQGIFIFLCVYALLTILLLRIFIFNIKPLAKSEPKKFSFFAGYALILKNELGVYLILVQAFVFSIMTIFLTHASFIYQQWFSLSNFQFSLLFGLNIVVMCLLNLLNRWLLRWFYPGTLLIWAVCAQAVVILALCLLIHFTPIHLLAFTPFIMLTIGLFGAISPNNQACYLQCFPNNTATAVALMGAIHLVIGGSLSALSVELADGSLRPIMIMMAICGCIAIVCASRAFWIMKKIKLSHQF